MRLYIKKPVNIYYVLISILIMMFSLYGYLFNNFIGFALLLTTACSLTFYYLLVNKKFVFNQNNIILIAAFFCLNLIFIIGIYYTEFAGYSINTLAFRILVVTVGILLFFEDGWQKFMISILYFGSLVHVFLTSFSFFFTDFFTNLILPIFPAEVTDTFYRFYSRGFYSGITTQTGTNGYLISIAIMISFVYLITNKNKKRNFSLLLISVFALILSGKRGHIVVSLVAIIFILFFYYWYRRKKIISQIAKVVLICFLIILVIWTVFPNLHNNLLRFMPNDGDFTSGRINLYNKAVQMIVEKPILGWGGSTFGNIHGKTVHNSYLQIFVEHGVFALLLFVFILFFGLYNTISRILKWKNNSKKKDTMLFISLYYQIFFILRGFIASPFHYNFVLIIYMIAIAIQSSLNLKRGW